MFKAKVILDSLNSERADAVRLTTMEVTYPRFIHSEFMTHRQFCLSGDTELYFDLPGPVFNRLYKMTIRDFVTKWHFGAAEHTASRYRRKDLSLISDESIYSAREIAVLLGLKTASNIRTAARNGKIKTCNPNKTKTEDFRIRGIDFKIWENSRGTRSFSIKDRLMKMRIRQLDENSGLIQHSNIIDCCFSGEKDVYRIYAGGKTIKSTLDHQFLTNNGWKRLEDIDIKSDFIFVQKFGILQEDKVDEYRFKKINGRWVPVFLRQIKEDKVKEQNNLCFDCKIVLEDSCELHHLVPIHEDISLAFDFNNIVAICDSCHKARHKKQGWQVKQYLHGIAVKIDKIEYIGIEDTYDVSIDGDYANFIADGFVVHNSRNSASSRAIPTDKLIKQVVENPAMPIHWGKLQKGMSAKEEVDEFERPACKAIWLEARDAAVAYARLLKGKGLHKQIVNRILEPFMWHTVIVSSTEWSNFYALRDHEDAQPEIAHLARLMREAHNQSTPIARSVHWPYIDLSIDWDAACALESEFGESAGDLITKVSCARCARVSYLTHDGKRDLREDLKLFDHLTKGSGHGHWSPMEHVAFATKSDVCSGNFKGWLQFRKSFAGECQ